MRKRIIPLCIVFIIAFLAFILYWCGFRITYAPEIENDWNAIGASAAWASVIAAIAAVFSAIDIANRQNSIAERQAEIAEQQNNIALFEKRLEFYDIADNCISVGQLLDKCSDRTAVFLMILTVFERDQIHKYTHGTISTELLKEKADEFYYRSFHVLKQGKFLFEFDTEKYVIPLVGCLMQIIGPEKPPEETAIIYEAYKNVATAAQNELIPQIENLLKQNYANR